MDVRMYVQCCLQERGSRARGDMTGTYRNGPTRFMDGYHQRSAIGAVFGAIKRMYGNHLRSRRRAR